MSVSTRIVRDSSDVDVEVSGSLEPGEVFEQVILDPRNFPDTRAVKLNAVFHSIQTKVVILLYWEGEEDHNLIMPIEGRGVLSLERFGGRENPRLPGWTGRVLMKAVSESTFPAHFSLSLEFSKQRS